MSYLGADRYIGLARGSHLARFTFAIGSSVAAAKAAWSADPASARGAFVDLGVGASATLDLADDERAWSWAGTVSDPLVAGSIVVEINGSTAFDAGGADTSAFVVDPPMGPVDVSATGSPTSGAVDFLIEIVR